MLNWRLASIVCTLVLLANCGRRQRTIFLFPHEKTIHFATLQFPSPKIINMIQNAHGATIEWLEVPVPTCIQDTAVQLAGYNVYRLTHQGFIPKSPLNKDPITITSYHDTSKTLCNRYIVRALFIVNNQILEGPTSNIGYCSKI
jgi:hypothetical protein